MTKLPALACVVGDMDLVRPLGLAGVRCAVVARRGAPTRFSRFACAAIDWLDAWRHPEELAARLAAFARAQPEPPVLFYEEDRDLLLVSRYRDMLQECFRFVVADAELVEGLVDKSQFQDLARRLDLPVPRSVRLTTDQSACPDIPLEFPVVVKPLTRKTEFWTRIQPQGKALRVDTRAVFEALWPRLRGAPLELMAQEEVPGPETRIESYHCYVDGEGEIAGEFTGRKIRTLPADYGVSTALEITSTPDVRELGRDLVRRLRLTGVAKLDFKRAPDGRLYLLEVNPRFNLWHYPGALAGVNLPALVYADLCALPRPPAGRARAGVRWCWPWHDAAAARKAGIPPARWLAWMIRCEAKSTLALDDPMPFLRGVALAQFGRPWAPQPGGREAAAAPRAAGAAP